jgi:hypothetical protein
MYTPLTYRHYGRILREMLDFIETTIFTKRFDKLSDDEGLRAIQAELNLEPEKGSVIQGTGGCRKLRAAHKERGKGKRGGIRIIYFLRNDIAYLLMAYSKDEKDDISPETKKQLRQITDYLKEEA